MDESKLQADLAAKDAGVTNTINQMLGSLQQADVPQDASVTAAPQISQPDAAQQVAHDATQQVAPAAPASAPDATQQVVRDPTTGTTTVSAPPAFDVLKAVPRDAVRGMFSNQAVQPVETPQTAEPADTPIAEPENMGEKAKNAWAELRSRERALRQVAADRQKQIAELKEAQEKFQRERTQMADALKKKDDELKASTERLGKLDLSGSLEFRQRYDQPLGQAVANLDAVIHDEIEGADSEEEVAKIRDFIVRGSDTDFQEYIAGLPVDAQGSLIEKRRTCLELAAQRQQALDRWQDTRKGLTASAAQQNAADAALARQRYAEDAIRFNAAELPPDRRAYVLTDSAFGEDVANANEEFKAFMQTATDEEMARAAYLGHLMPSMNRALLLALKEAREYQEALYVQRGVMRPSVRASTPEAPKPVPPPAVPKTVEQMNADSEAKIAAAIAPLLH